MTTRQRGSRGAMPAGAIVVVALALAAVVGLIAGAVWGQVGGGSSSASSSTVPTPAPTQSSSVAPTPSSSAASPSDTSSPQPGPSDASPTDSGSPGAPTPVGSAPPAPATTTTSADGWRLGSWKVTSTGGTLGIDTTARNTATGTRSATLILYVYVNGVHIATTTAVVTDVPAGGTVPVHFSGTDPWQPGQKVLLLATQ